MSNDKVKITDVIYQLCKDKLDNNSDIDKLYFDWWVTGRTGQGLRLTENGRKAFELAEIEFYEFPLFNEKAKLTTSFKASEYILKLGKKVRCPFYIGLRNKHFNTAYIRIYDSKIAMLISIYGSIAEYVQSVK